jgi:ring-1,2-phenylacetyl-CoA epoxidase subunit PaaE
MALFGLFGKKSTEKTHKGFQELNIAEIVKLTSDTVKVVFDVPAENKKEFGFKSGQYVDVIIDINGKEERRSYSICSGTNEPLAIAVKAIENGKVSTWFNKQAKIGTTIPVSVPKGNFTLPAEAKNCVAIAAGSGITPILSIAKEVETRNGNLRLFYGNRNVSSIIFKYDLESLNNTFVTHFLSGETAEGFEQGRITKESFTAVIKNDLSLLRADAYFICGPEEMIVQVSEVLRFFGVPDKKIHFELFTTPVLMAAKEEEVVAMFEGMSKVKVILDGEAVNFELGGKGKTILEAVESEGLDAPFSCKGGVCCSCKAKVIKGSARMSMNFSLTDEEVKKGYILTCQAHPTSEDLTISFDD